MDYNSLGLKIGLEIHQQLASGTKLFCSCPVPRSTDERPDEFFAEVRRKMRPVAGETGNVDIAVLYEFLRNRTFAYRSGQKTSCLIELDEQPPKPVSKKALETALQICKLLNCTVLDEIHFMRKAVIDGSAVSGFQRTAFLGMNGYIDTAQGRTGIKSISLEEDSAAPCDSGYKLDRLGIPLVEIATDSGIKSPEHAKEVAEEIGLLLRSVDVVRGIGSIRQDVNVSIEKGARIEIKGFQELEKMPEVIGDEIQRQIALAEIKSELMARGARHFGPGTRTVTHLFHDTKCSFIRKAVENGGMVVAGKLPLFAGLLKKQCGDRTLGKDLSDHAIGYGIIHSDEDLDRYGLREEFDVLRRELNAGERDAVFIISGDKPADAAKLVSERASQCLAGVPEETRVADGSGSRYTRPLPGSGRMYPESDIPPIKISREYLCSIKLPKTLSQVRGELSKKMPEELASQIVRSRYLKEFQELSQEYEPVLVAAIFLSYFRDMSRRGLDVERVSIHDVEKMLSRIKEGSVPKDAAPGILEKLASGDNLVKVLSSYSTLSDAEIKSIVKETVAQNPGLNESAAMGIIMQKLRGRASGGKVMQFVKEEMMSSAK